MTTITTGDMPFPVIALLGLAGSADNFWLLVFGVNEEKWISRADSIRTI